MVNKRQKSLISIIFLISLSLCAFAQNTYNIDYYGVVAKEVDSNLYKMTSDLYFTQLNEINAFVISDKRQSDQLESAPETSLFSTQNLSFYAVIEKKEDTNTWIATLNIIDKKNSIKKSNSKEYDSYYKILMEPKSVLQESLKNLITKEAGISTNKAETQPENNSIKGLKISSVENLSGNWDGEKGISKIVIMRGGRGFIIFDNGASMNITLAVTGSGSSSQLVVTQNGKSNASYYPELPRAQALNAALTAEPIKWIFSLSDENTLTGTKQTLVSSGESVTNGSVNVKWKRK